MEDKVTTLKIKRSIILRLREYQLHPREPHAEIIGRILDEKEKRSEELKVGKKNVKK